MRTARLTELPVKHLDYVFSPPGLPLPAKGEGALGTTSILVRGGAGTGKTTFALALAHAIAKTNRGLVLYLTTEFSPVEITFKATLLGLPEEAVDVWPGRAELSPGGVVVENLSEVRRGQPILSSAERRRSSIDAVWRLLHPEKEGAAQPSLPVRSVVIDALTLPELGENDGAQRAELVAFVQALENEGVSVVLVEELAPGAAAWSSFVVDVVFELAFQPDPETQDLRRKLTLSKCRHALSIPGPHDYGLEDGVPAAWPDLFRVVTIAQGKEEQPLFKVASPRLALPLADEGKWILIGGSVVLSPYDKTAMAALLVLERTPGIKKMSIHCRGRTRITAASRFSYVNEDDGPHAIGWAALSIARTTGTNLCIFNSLEKLLSRPDSIARVSRLLEALSLMGFMVCVHSPRDALRPLDATADLIWDRTKLAPRTFKPRRHVRYASQRLAIPYLRDTNLELKPQEDSDAANPAIADEYSLLDGYLPETDMLPGVDDLSSALEGATKGQHIDSLILSGLVLLEAPLGHSAAWLALHTGFDWHAGCGALSSVEAEKPKPTMLLLWKSICAAIALNRNAIEELKALLGTPDEALVFGPLLRGLAGTDQLDEADRIIAEVGARHALLPWMLDRLSADTRLDSARPAALRDAVRHLKKLAADDSLPPLTQAEIWHNMGTALDRLGKRAGAISCFRRACTLNPSLDAAREELERLQASKSAPS